MARFFSALCLTLAALFAGAAAAHAEPVSAADAAAARAVVRPSSRRSRATTRSVPSRMPRRRSGRCSARPSGSSIWSAPATRSSTAGSRATFLLPLRVDGQLYQGVHLTDAAGVLWLATYRLERQPDGSLGIAGCAVEPAHGRIT